eukprot:3324690-Amphidinium_carterae.1
MCLLVHARLRFSDGLRLRGEFVIDCDPGGADLFIEAQAEEVKMSYKPRHWRVPLPVVALASGLLGRPWARRWLELRRLAGINALDFLMPVPAPDGKRFGHTPIRCAEASVWLRELLRPSSVDALSTHSCRAT